MSKLSPRAKKWLITAACAVAVIAVAFAASTFFLKDNKPNYVLPEEASQISDIEEPEIITEPVSEDAITLLFCGLDDSAGLTDVISVISFDVKAGKINVLQIPRDTYIGDGYKTGKINQVYFAHKRDDEPIRGLIKVLDEQMSLSIDYYMVMTLKNFRDIIDSMGGVDVDIPQRIEFLPDKIIEEGAQHLNGEQAEWFVRYRAGYRLGDIGRINAQKLMVDALVQKVHDLGRREMLKLASKNFRNITTDLPLSKALSLASEAFAMRQGDIQSFVIEGRGKTHMGYDVYEVYKPELTELLNTYFRPYSRQVEYIAMAQIPPPKPPESKAEAEAEGEELSDGDEIIIYEGKEQEENFPID